MVLVAGESATALSPGVLALVKGMVFPVGLSMIVLSNSELMTGNLLTQSLPSLRVSPLSSRLKVLAISAAGNLAGKSVRKWSCLASAVGAPRVGQPGWACGHTPASPVLPLERAGRGGVRWPVPCV
jgi:formate/nitrite transporter FocA (FNT family)